MNDKAIQATHRVQCTGDINAVSEGGGKERSKAGGAKVGDAKGDAKGAAKGSDAPR